MLTAGLQFSVAPLEPALPKHASEQHLAPPGTTGYNTGTFTRPKQKIKKSPVKDMVENQVSSSSSSTGSPTNADSLNSDTHHDTPTKYKRATKKPRENGKCSPNLSTTQSVCPFRVWLLAGPFPCAV